MWSFVSFSLFATGAAFIAVPVIIHLINLMRHRRIEWAAMEFLLDSKKKNSTYVWLKQLLLLLCRMAAILLIALILGQLLLKDDFFTSGKTHHVVILHDDLSTSEIDTDGKTALARGKQAVQQIGDAAALESGHRLTLLRTSRKQPVISAQNADTEFPTRLKDTLTEIESSERSLGLTDSIKLARDLIGPAEGERRVIYIVSDFRLADWETAGDVRELLAEVEDGNTQLVFVDTSEGQRSNLAVTDVRPLTASPAANVPIRMSVTVKNFGPDPARDVRLTIREDGDDRPDRPTFERIAPGEERTILFESMFSTAGPHDLSVRLENDALPADNTRHVVINTRLAAGILLVDGQLKDQEAPLVRDALNPGGSARSPYAPEIQPPNFLAEAELNRYAAIYLFNIEFLDPQAVKNLEAYVAQGGGLCIFVGAGSDGASLNTLLYKDGSGLLPAPLSAPRMTEARLRAVRRDGTDPGLSLTRSPHDIFGGQFAVRNSPLAGVRFLNYWKLQPGWIPVPDQPVEIILKLENDDPLALERRFGDGKVVMVLTAINSQWNSWPANLSLPITVHEITNYIASTQGESASHTVGEPLVVTVPQAKYNGRAGLVPPGETNVGSLMTAESIDDGAFYRVTFPVDEDDSTGVGRSGVYSVALEPLDGPPEQREYAFNVPTQEGHLAKVTREQLDAQLTDVEYQLLPAEGLGEVVGEAAETNLSEAFLYLLVGLLFLEQILAYLFSYHPPTGKGASR